MNIILSEIYSEYKNDISDILKHFGTRGTMIGDGGRNVIKIFEGKGRLFNFKSFKQHNIINRHVYKFYRKSKARRSFEYAQLLLEKNFYTPKPVGYIENHDCIGLTSSFYISEQLENSRTLAEILADGHFSERTNIIKGYTHLIYNLHEKGILFIDNAAGNFLVKREEESYRFYMVDLNRMNFYDHLEIEKRLKNFARFTIDPEIIKIISEEYARLSGMPAEFCLKKINEASRKMLLKRKIKKVLKLYKHIIKI